MVPRAVVFFEHKDANNIHMKEGGEVELKFTKPLNTIKAGI